jgi:hypothetical protein
MKAYIDSPGVQCADRRSTTAVFEISKLPVFIDWTQAGLESGAHCHYEPQLPATIAVLHTPELNAENTDVVILAVSEKNKERAMREIEEIAQKEIFAEGPSCVRLDRLSWHELATKAGNERRALSQEVMRKLEEKRGNL